MRHRPRFAPALPASLCLLFSGAMAAGGCRRSADAPLPPLADNPYAYSLAVAEKAGRRAVAGRALAIHNVGRVHERFGMEDLALVEYDRALAEDPVFGEAHRRKAFILSQSQDRMPAAVESYQASLRVEPNHPGVATRIGLVLTHLGRLDEALEWLEVEVRGGTADDATYYNLGEVRFLQEKYAEAEQSYREAIRRQPLLREAHYGLARTLGALGRAAEQQAALDRFQELKRADAESEAARAARKDNRAEQLEFAAATWVDAADLYLAEAARAAAPEGGDAFLAAGVEALRSAIEIAPALLEPHRRLIELHRSRGNLAAATSACDAALRAVGDDPGLLYVLAGLNIDLAEPGSAREREHLARALELLRKAVTAAPEVAEAHHDLASIILARFKERPDLLPEALRHARLAVEKKSAPRNYDVLAWAYFRSDRSDLASATLVEGLRLFPDDTSLKERLRLFSESHP